MKLHRWEDIRAEAAKAPGFEEAVERERREVIQEIVEYHLAELRQLRQLTQVELARQIGITQPALSAMEKRSDVQLSTLRDYVAGLGGALELTAVFDGDVRVPLVLDAGTGTARPALRTKADVPADKPTKKTKTVNRAPPPLAQGGKAPIAPAPGIKSMPTRKGAPRLARAATKQSPAPRASRGKGTANAASGPVKRSP